MDDKQFQCLAQAEDNAYQAYKEARDAYRNASPSDYAGNYDAMKAAHAKWLMALDASQNACNYEAKD